MQYSVKQLNVLSVGHKNESAIAKLPKQNQGIGAHIANLSGRVLFMTTTKNLKSE
jgi:hypothetical protein